MRAYGNDAVLKPGEYEIKPRASMHEIMELLKSGKSVMYSLTIPEGLTVEQALQRVAEQDALTGDNVGVENNVPQGGVVWVFAVKK